MRSRSHARSDRLALSAPGAALAAACGVTLALVALTFGAMPLLVPGIGFVLIGVAATVWIAVGARGAQATRRVDARRVIEGESFEITLEVTRGRLGAPGAVVWDPLAGETIPVARRLSARSRRGTLELALAVRIERRGHHTFPPPTLMLSDPLRLATAERRGPGAADQLLVLPRTEAVFWTARSQHRRARGGQRPSSREQRSAGELDGLRQYQQGTPAARIHWPALARGAGLLERRLASAPESQPLVVLDARAESSTDGRARLDAAVRAAASLTLELSRTGGCRLLLAGERAALAIGSDLAAWPAAHARLALVELEPLDGAPPAPPPGDSLIWVTASPELELPAGRAAGFELVLLTPVTALARAGPGAALRRRLPMPSFEVAGCAGFVLRTGRARMPSPRASRG
jgi:uncharacterized protein (DUF58 family)